MISVRAAENIFTGSRTQESFRGSGLRFCNLLFEADYSDPGAVLPLCLFSEVQKISSTGIGVKTAFRACILRFCNIFQVNKFALRAVILSCVVLEIQEKPSPGVEIRIFFQSFSVLCSLPFSRNMHDKSGANRFVHSRAISG